MNIEYMSKKIKGRVPLPEGNYKEFAVLIPLIYISNELNLIFEIRSKELNTQPGEICFPGGGLEKKENIMECAIRETSEELNILKDKIDILGPCNYIVTPFNLILYPFVGLIKNTNISEINFNKDEVASIFTVPLEFFIKTPPDIHYVETSLDVPNDFPFEKIQNGKVYNWRTGKYPILFYEYNNNIIWGMTARIINDFINLLKA